MRKLYAFDTRIGTFFIVEEAGEFHPMFNEKRLGSYATAQLAAEDLADGNTRKVKQVEDTSELGIPYDLDEWEHLEE
jgi:hypothetical protein